MTSIYEKLKVGNSYSKKELSVALAEINIAGVREGIYSSKKYNSLLLFVDLVKDGKEERFHFNDYFQDDYFHWDSQPKQHFDTPMIQSIVLGKVNIELFVRIDQRIKSVVQPFRYCGRLTYLDHDKNSNRPIHIIFNAIDYDENNNGLEDIYLWKPENVGRQSRDYQTDLPAGNKKPRINIKPNFTERRGLITSRVGQGFYRQEILKKWSNVCAVTGLEIEGILIASHILPWSKSTDNERLDADNGILLSPNLDALFDKHLISFTDSGDILINSKILPDMLIYLGLNKGMKLSHINDGMKKYLAKCKRKITMYQFRKIVMYQKGK